MTVKYIKAFVEWIETPKHEHYEIDSYMYINEQNITAIKYGVRDLPDTFWVSDGSQYLVSEYSYTNDTVVKKVQRTEGSK